MRIAGINKNDTINGDDGFCVTLFMQGCPHHCPGCFNEETWSFSGGKEVPFVEVLKEIEEAIPANGIIRNLALSGGDPLCEQNFATSAMIAGRMKLLYPEITVYAWTGYTMEYLQEERPESLLACFDVIIDGKFEEELKDITLSLRGSSNQRIWRKETKGGSVKWVN